MRITEETNPWAYRDAVLAAEYASHHENARQVFEIEKSPEIAQDMVSLQSIREDHQKKTGWVAEHQGDECWRFTYMDPDTRLNGGTPVTITTKETQS